MGSIDCLIELDLALMISEYIVLSWQTSPTVSLQETCVLPTVVSGMKVLVINIRFACAQK